LAVETGWPKEATDNFSVKVESARGDQRGTFEVHSADYVLKESERVLEASSPCDSRRPEPRPDVNRGEDPDRVFLAADDRANLVYLKLLDGEGSYFSIVEPTTDLGGLFEPASDGIPGNSLYSSNHGLVQALDAERGDFVEGRATVLETIVWRTVFEQNVFSQIRHRYRRRFPEWVWLKPWRMMLPAPASLDRGHSLFGQLTLFIVPEACGLWN
jgi:hypothetical protein